MTDDELAMAYADGELDALSAKRFERRMAEEPALGVAVASHRALRSRLSAGFAPVAAEPVPDRLSRLVESNVVPLAPRNRQRLWWTAGAMAASLAVGVSIGQFRPATSVTVADGRLIASGPLATALDTQLASNAGDTRVLVSFQDASKTYCRVFKSPTVDGIACHEPTGWTLRQTHAPTASQSTDYRQAGSTDAPLMAAAQDMMAGDPLDATAEARAREANWK